MEGRSGHCARNVGSCVVRFALRAVTKHTKFVVVAAVTVYGVVKVARHLRMKKLRAKWDAVGKDVVVLHTMPRSYYSPCLTPFAVKLETFFRMMGIKYELDFEEPMGPKNKVPWITLNGVDYSDSEFIIQALQVKFNKFPDANVLKENLAVGLAMRVVMEEHLYWGLVSWRFMEDDLKGLMTVHDFPPMMAMMFRAFKGKLRTALYLQGMGRHSYEEIHQLVKLDLEALSSFLGTKDFLLGSNPQVVDCAIFSSIIQLLTNSPGCPYIAFIDNKLPNLRPYCERMKTRFWPDWNQCITKPEITL